MDTYSVMAQQIIHQQQVIVGPLAVSQAKRVAGLEIGSNGMVSGLSGDGKVVVEKLVREYEKLFGQASLDVCKDAVREIKPPVPQEQLPDILK